MKYRLLDHTADLKVEIYGKDLVELFANAAFMLFDVMVDTGQVQERMQAEVELTSGDIEELFLDWLRELLYRFATKGFVTKRVEVKVCPEREGCQPPKPESGSGHDSVRFRASAVSRGVEVKVQPVRLRGTLYGENYESKRHGLKIEIKNPTYHQFRIEKVEGGRWKATVVFDV
ncbi:MAG: archease [candidate division WOR-3 bacterium]